MLNDSHSLSKENWFENRFKTIVSEKELSSFLAESMAHSISRSDGDSQSSLRNQIDQLYQRPRLDSRPSEKAGQDMKLPRINEHDGNADDIRYILAVRHYMYSSYAERSARVYSEIMAKRNASGHKRKRTGAIVNPPVLPPDRPSLSTSVLRTKNPLRRVPESLSGINAECLDRLLTVKSQLDDVTDEIKLRARRDPRIDPFLAIRRSGFFCHNAAWKLLELDACFDYTLCDPRRESSQLLFCDLGAAPGGFSEYILMRHGWRCLGIAGSLELSTETLSLNPETIKSNVDVHNLRSESLDLTDVDSISRFLQSSIRLVEDHWDPIRKLESRSSVSKDNPLKPNKSESSCSELDLSYCKGFRKKLAPDAKRRKGSNSSVSGRRPAQQESETGKATKINLQLEKSCRYHLVTGDASIDVGGAENLQEFIHAPLLLGEAATSLCLVATGGNVVLKCFDMFEATTIRIAYVLSKCFAHFAIVKPRMSRDFNSERYMVATDCVLASDAHRVSIVSHLLCELVTATPWRGPKLSTGEDSNPRSKKRPRVRTNSNARRAAAAAASERVTDSPLSKSTTDRRSYYGARSSPRSQAKIKSMLLGPLIFDRAACERRHVPLPDVADDKITPGRVFSRTLGTYRGIGDMDAFEISMGTSVAVCDSLISCLENDRPFARFLTAANAQLFQLQMDSMLRYTNVIGAIGRDPDNAAINPKRPPLTIEDISRILGFRRERYSPEESSRWYKTRIMRDEDVLTVESDRQVFSRSPYQSSLFVSSVTHIQADWSPHINQVPLLDTSRPRKSQVRSGERSDRRMRLSVRNKIGQYVIDMVCALMNQKDSSWAYHEMKVNPYGIDDPGLSVSKYERSLDFYGQMSIMLGVSDAGDRTRSECWVTCSSLSSPGSTEVYSITDSDTLRSSPDPETRDTRRRCTIRSGSVMWQSIWSRWPSDCVLSTWTVVRSNGEVRVVILDVISLPGIPFVFKLFPRLVDRLRLLESFILGFVSPLNRDVFRLATWRKMEMGSFLGMIQPIRSFDASSGQMSCLVQCDNPWPASRVPLSQSLLLSDISISCFDSDLRDVTGLRHILQLRYAYEILKLTDSLRNSCILHIPESRVDSPDLMVHTWDILNVYRCGRIRCNERTRDCYDCRPLCRNHSIAKTEVTPAVAQREKSGDGIEVVVITQFLKAKTDLIGSIVSQYVKMFSIGADRDAEVVITVLDPLRPNTEKTPVVVDAFLKRRLPSSSVDIVVFLECDFLFLTSPSMSREICRVVKDSGHVLFLPWLLRNKHPEYCTSLMSKEHLLTMERYQEMFDETGHSTTVRMVISDVQSLSGVFKGMGHHSFVYLDAGFKVHRIWERDTRDLIRFLIPEGSKRRDAFWRLYGQYVFIMRQTVKRTQDHHWIVMDLPKSRRLHINLQNKLRVSLMEGLFMKLLVR